MPFASIVVLQNTRIIKSFR